MQNSKKLPRPPEYVSPKPRILSVHLSTKARYLNSGKQSTIFLTYASCLTPSSLLTEMSNWIHPSVLMNFISGTFDFLMYYTSQYYRRVYRLIHLPLIRALDQHRHIDIPVRKVQASGKRPESFHRALARRILDELAQTE
jgi:hypothetical protein